MKSTILQLSFLFFSVVLITACTPADEKLRNQISESEKALYSDSTMVPDTSKAKSMIDLYMSYVEKFPSDTNSPDYLFRAADIASKTNDVHTSVQLFGKLVKDYPTHRHTPIAVFLQGFIYENQAGDPMKAKPFYEEFLSKYPDHPMANDAAFSLENLGKTPEELIRGFEQTAGQEVSENGSKPGN